jgi:thymidylate kinase
MEPITNSVVNLNQVATQESKQVDILTELSSKLAYNENNMIKQKIVNMLFDTLAEYRARKNSPKGAQQSKIAWVNTFWIEVDNFFGSILAYEAIYEDYRLQTVQKCLQDLGRFPTLLEGFNKIAKRRQQEREQFAEKQRIDDEKRFKFLEEVSQGKHNGLAICIGTSALVPSQTIIKPVNLSKTTRSGKIY